MEIKDIKELIDKVNSSELAFFELKIDENYIKMDKSLTRNLSEGKLVETQDAKISAPANITLEQEVAVSQGEVKKIEDKVESDNLEVIKAPMVGTFYGSPSPEKDSFVSEGKSVKKGNVLCIVEAMKLMNEIECEFDCEIVQILVKDGDMVEYGQPIFKIRRA